MVMMRGRNQVAGVFDGGADAVAALAHGGVGQADGVEVVLLGDDAAVVDLDVNEVGVDAVDGRAEGFEEHGMDVHGVYQRRDEPACDAQTAPYVAERDAELPIRTLQSHRDYESLRPIQDRRGAFEFAHDGADARGVPLCVELGPRGLLDRVARVQMELYGSLALTGMGHATDRAVLLGLSGNEPATIDPGSD